MALRLWTRSRKCLEPAFFLLLRLRFSYRIAQALPIRLEVSSHFRGGAYLLLLCGIYIIVRSIIRVISLERLSLQMSDLLFRTDEIIGGWQSVFGAYYFFLLVFTVNTVILSWFRSLFDLLWLHNKDE